MTMKEGFTLVDLLIVVAIIAILIVIPVPMIGDAMKKAKATRIGVIIRNVEQAAKQYIMTYLPNIGNDIIEVNDLIRKGYLNSNDVLNNIDLELNIHNTIYEVKVRYVHENKDGELINMIENVLKEAYSIIAKSDQEITVIATGNKFW